MGLFRQKFEELQAFFDKHNKVLIKDDIVNNLESDETEKVLSAAQGKALKSLIPSKYTLPVASSKALGGIQLGFTQTGKKYPVMVEGNKAYVEVPWTDNNTTYSAATADTLGLVKQGVAVASAAGDNVTKAEFEALLTSLKNAGVIASK